MSRPAVRLNEHPEPVVLALPEPSSPNRAPSHAMVRHRGKRGYQRLAWGMACAQCVPPAEPPARVRIDAHFRLHLLRDDDNLRASLKYVLDALRQRQANPRWRRGIYEDRGYFIDDDPAHLALGDVTQAIDRRDRGLTLVITPIA